MLRFSAKAFSCDTSPARRILYKSLASQDERHDNGPGGPMIPLLGASFDRSSKQSTISDAISQGYNGLFATCGISEKKIGQGIYAQSPRGFVLRPSLFLSSVLALPLTTQKHSFDDQGFKQGHYYSQPIENHHTSHFGSTFPLIKSQVKSACVTSISNLNADQYLDLYLMPFDPSADAERTSKVWAAMEALVDEGLVRSIGLCGGFTGQARLESILQKAHLSISVNQIDVRYLSNKALLSFASGRNIHTIATLPTLPLPNDHGYHKVLEISTRLNRSAQEVWARWAIEMNCSAVLKDPESKTLSQCLKVFDWKLEEKDMESLNSIALNEGDDGPSIRIPQKQQSLGDKYEAFGASGINFN
jgi:diketogulonate reductase-like aldo/keto reductase